MAAANGFEGMVNGLMESIQSRRLHCPATWRPKRWCVSRQPALYRISRPDLNLRVALEAGRVPASCLWRFMSGRMISEGASADHPQTCLVSMMKNLPHRRRVMRVTLCIPEQISGKSRPHSRQWPKSIKMRVLSNGE
jgi:hypothetical protein